VLRSAHLCTPRRDAGAICHSANHEEGTPKWPMPNTLLVPALPISPAITIKLLVAGFSFFATERADQEDKIEGMRHYGSDLRNILRERSQVSVEQACGILR
jgi:hypothetical protein